MIGLAATSALFIPVGASMGQFLFARMNQVLFERLVLGIIVLGVLAAVYQGVSVRAAQPSHHATDHAVPVIQSAHVANGNGMAVTQWPEAGTRR